MTTKTAQSERRRDVMYQDPPPVLSTRNGLNKTPPDAMQTHMTHHDLPHVPTLLLWSNATMYTSANHKQYAEECQAHKKHWGGLACSQDWFYVFVSGVPHHTPCHLPSHYFTSFMYTLKRRTFSIQTKKSRCTALYVQTYGMQCTYIWDPVCKEITKNWFPLLLAPLQLPAKVYHDNRSLI